MLPPGTLAALKGHFDGIVAVVALAIASGAMAAGAPPLWTVAALAIALVLYHIRCKSKEKHEEHMAQNKINEAMIKVEAIKARHRELLSVDQPSLGLENRSRRTATRKRDS